MQCGARCTAAALEHQAQLKTSELIVAAWGGRGSQHHHHRPSLLIVLAAADAQIKIFSGFNNKKIRWQDNDWTPIRIHRCYQGRHWKLPGEGGKKPRSFLIGWIRTEVGVSGPVGIIRFLSAQRRRQITDFFWKQTKSPTNTRAFVAHDATKACLNKRGWCRLSVRVGGSFRSSACTGDTRRWSSSRLVLFIAMQGRVVHRMLTGDRLCAPLLFLLVPLGLLSRLWRGAARRWPGTVVGALLPCTVAQWIVSQSRVLFCSTATRLERMQQTCWKSSQWTHGAFTQAVHPGTALRCSTGPISRK